MICLFVIKNSNNYDILQTDSNLPDDVKSTRQVDYGDIFLNRLFHTKVGQSIITR